MKTTDLAPTQEQRPGWLWQLVRLFQRQPKTPKRITQCVECGKDITTDECGPRIHLMCQIERMEKAKASELLAAQERRQIELMKTAIREIEAEKSNKSL